MLSVREGGGKQDLVTAARAAKTGRSLQEYLRGQLTALAQRPDPDALWDSVRQRKATSPMTVSPEDILAHRDVDRR